MNVTPAQWQAVKSLVTAALDLPRSERDQHLCSGSDDPVILAEARSLLVEYERDEFIDFPGMKRFLARRRVGSGGFGTVYEAYDAAQQIVLALKVLRDANYASLERFKREFWTLRELDHPNLVRLYQLFQDEQRWFFTMQLVRGTDLLSYIQRKPKRDWVEIRDTILQLCRGVHALHLSGKVHRDLKPDNVLVTATGKVVLIDLGMARDVTAGPVQQSVAIVGSAPYLSPEQGSSGTLSEATDWYSVGVILFEAVTGRYPFDGDLFQIIEQKQTRKAPEAAGFVPDIPADINDLCRDLLQRDPASRPTGPSVLARLGDLQPQTPVSPTGTPIFIGRGQVLIELRGLFERVLDSHSSAIVNVRGKSGIGKSTLLREFERQLLLSRPEALILTARCHESAQIRFKALDPLIDKIVAYLKLLAPLEVNRVLPTEVPSLVRLFPALKEIPAIARIPHHGAVPPASQELRELAFDALLEMLMRLCESKPVAIFLDDLQWADNDSAVFFRHLLRQTSPPNLLILISYRSEDMHSSPFLSQYRNDLSHVNSTASVSVVDYELREFSPDETRHLTQRLVDVNRDLDEVTLANIVRESGGIPFLIVEFVRHTNARTGAGRTPQLTLQGVIGERIAALPAAARSLLSIIAVAGQPVPETAAYEAAEAESDDFPGLQSLVDNSLVRVRETPNGRELETYHDRYREAVLQSLSTESRQRAHRALARGLSKQASPDPAFIATQLQLAGEERLSAEYFHAAADRAAGAFAFERAAEFYRLAYNFGSYSIADATLIASLRGEALIQAGRGREAAGVFRDAAANAPPLKRLELQRKAAEQLLRAGDLNDGLNLVRIVARTLGIRLGGKTWQTLLSLALRRSAIAIIGLRYRLRPPEKVSAKQLAILDTYWSLAVGLSLVDMVRASDFGARHLLNAIWVGEPTRIALSLALQAGHCMIQSNRRPQAERFLSHAKLLAAKHRQGQVLAIIEAMGAVCGYLAGEWVQAYERGIAGEKMLREECTGARWEIVTACIFSLKCLTMMGEWRIYEERLAPLLKEAGVKNDRYAHCGLILLTHAYIVPLIKDDPESARQTIRDALADWSQAGFHLQDFFAFYGETETDLYLGEYQQAVQRVRASWRKLNDSLLMRGQVVRILAHHLYARVLLSAAFEARSEDSRTALELQRQALSLSRVIEKENTQWSTPIFQFLDATASVFNGDISNSLRLLAAAEEGFSVSGMAQYRAAVQWCRGQLSPGKEGGALIRSAESWAAATSVKNPGRLFRLLAPGDWKCMSS